MAEKIEIRGIGHPSDTMMTISDPEDTRYLVFDKAIFPHLELGKIIQLTDDGLQMNVPKKSGEGTYNLIKSILVDGKKIGSEKRRGYTPRGRDEDRTDRRNAIITIKDIWLSGKIKDDNPLVTWLLAELLVIAMGKKEAKGEATKTSKDSKVSNQSQDKGEDSGQNSDEMEPPKTAGELFTWIMKRDKNIKAPRAWLEANYEVSHGEILTIEKIRKLYAKIKKDKGW